MQTGQRVVVTPPGVTVPVHRILLSLHPGQRPTAGQSLWCSPSTTEAELCRFLLCVEKHR